ncbi:hypothetical protein GCK72_018942 [Caenorhabditis remanei]|uniref:T20D4.11-like domain-containing protein n=1 Tax=Caenorhabditis remanei TaxID=31234 RepID=E3M052_CAERE|nr:hypothetical protein GCK72_018942 [Caenorhabditis remanei]EFO87590.1 hypothetical protein CRE_05588 [Caenorhabditis remanei]KAF1752387.1 hypothetical protein GCK72_018942 [Caenorhabditis remanei]
MSWLSILVPFLFFTLTTDGKPTSSCVYDIFGLKISKCRFVSVTLGHCKTVKFLYKDFSSCTQKLENRNSTCAQDYNPFPGINPEDFPSILVNDRNESCDDLFGDKDCLKTEITELCGKDEYDKFREMQVDLAKSFRICKAKV